VKAQPPALPWKNTINGYPVSARTEAGLAMAMMAVIRYLQEQEEAQG
jgi:hypothetical protein